MLLNCHTHRVYNRVTKAFEFYRGLPESVIDNPQYIIQKYTGFDDINGVSIYEGDLVISNCKSIQNYVVHWDEKIGAFIIKEEGIETDEAWERANFVYEHILLSAWIGLLTISGNISSKC